MDHTVAVLGLGVMGSRAATRFSATGASVNGFDPLPEVREQVADAGVTPCATAAEAVKDVDVVVLSLPMPEDVLATARTELSDLPEATVVIDLSTIDPETAKSAADVIGRSGAAYLDAPILGSPDACGNWTLLVGGPADRVAQVRAVLETSIAGSVAHIGDVGTGSTVKLLNNLMFGTINAVTAEVLNVSRLAGIEPERFAAVVGSSGAGTVSPLFRNLSGRITTGEFAPRFAMRLLQKDNRLALELARSVGAPTFVAGCVDQLNSLVADNEAWAGEDTGSVYKLYELLTSKEQH